MELRGGGVHLDLPAGWEAEISTPGPRARSGPDDNRYTVVHVANFPLPPERGDFGSGAVEVMPRSGALLVLFEYDPANAAKALFAASDLPRVAVGDFDPDRMQRPLPGQSGTQHFFHVGGRAFCLYVALGSHRERHVLVTEVNAVLERVTIAG